ncbi:uncharacterized protein BJ171DRAFT_221919 [Polychytrium aggregatum]|uniref:uncharacterized protein n=1 Tax=Polychytrium aggregatum TaxID=110093 RepID=UPI0022FE5708|nr:uncharacterized protein BJ171DRAFT_221919 [Polychytrium aggregatum]KAI9197511.1 hypothetical protein BJ171DRAFT_221919 [Polychytrium aggregatum]
MPSRPGFFDGLSTGHGLVRQPVSQPHCCPTLSRESQSAPHVGGWRGIATTLGARRLLRATVLFLQSHYTARVRKTGCATDQTIGRGSPRYGADAHRCAGFCCVLHDADGWILVSLPLAQSLSQEQPTLRGGVALSRLRLDVRFTQSMCWAESTWRPVRRPWLDDPPPTPFRLPSQALAGRLRLALHLFGSRDIGNNSMRRMPMRDRSRSGSNRCRCLLASLPQDWRPGADRGRVGKSPKLMVRPWSFLAGSHSLRVWFIGKGCWRLPPNVDPYWHGSRRCF